MLWADATLETVDAKFGKSVDDCESDEKETGCMFCALAYLMVCCVFLKKEGRLFNPTHIYRSQKIAHQECSVSMKMGEGMCARAHMQGLGGGV